MTLSAIPPLATASAPMDLSLAALAAHSEAGTDETAALAAPFTQILATLTQAEADHAATPEAPALPILSMGATESTPPPQDPHAPDRHEDASEHTPWPPDGLASLWLPIAPEMAPEPVCADSAPVLAEASAAEIETTAGITTTLTSHPSSAIATLTPPPLPDLPDSTPTPTPSAAPDALSPTPLEPPAFHLHTGLPRADVNSARHLPLGSSFLAPAPSTSDPDAFVPQASEAGSTPVLEATGLETQISGESPNAPDTSSAALVAAPSTRAPLAPAILPTPTPFPAPNLDADNFPDTLGTHIQWLAEHKIGHAHLQLTPHDMGPLEVRLKLDGDQLQAEFTSAEPEVRQALEHGLPRLRELLGEHGLHLSEGHIGHHQSQAHSAPPPPLESSTDTDQLPDTAPLPSPIVHTTHLLDAYA